MNFLFHLVILIASSAIWLKSGKRSAEFARAEYNPLSPLPLFDLKRPYLKVMTLGFINLYDDANYLNLLQVLNEEGPKRSPEAIEFFVHQSFLSRPPIESIYLFACLYFWKEMQRPWACPTASKPGIEAVPEDWRIPVVQGFILFKELKQPAQGARYLDYASSIANAPPYITSLSRRLINEEELTEEDLEKSLSLSLDHLKDSPFLETLKQKRRSSPP